MELKDVKHVLRVAYILAGAAAVALVVRAQFIPPSFGWYGWYRGASVRELMDMPKKYHGVENCKRCHEHQWQEWRKSPHQRVACESCHGPGVEHSQRDIHLGAKIFGTKELMARSHDLCLSCHARTPGRPAEFPQVVGAEHIALRSIAEKEPTDNRPVATGGAKVSSGAPRPEVPSLPEEYSCMFCHGADGTLAGSEDTEHLVVTPEYLASDVHWQKGLRCHDCHGGNPKVEDFVDHRTDENFRSLAVRERIPEFCGHCHFDAAYMRRHEPAPDIDQRIDYLANRHGRRLDGGQDTRLVTCVFCHGHHAIRRVVDLGAPKHCVACHKGHTPLR